MIYYFLYNKKGSAISYSKEPFNESGYDTDKFDHVEIDVNEDEAVKLRQPYEKKIRDGKLVIEDFPTEKRKKDITERIKNATKIDELKEIILEML